MMESANCILRVGALSLRGMRKFSMSHRIPPHPEEVPQVASRTMHRLGGTQFIIVLVLAAALTACAKRNDPSPPKGEPNTYPRAYPSE
jgi:hypothetical protein